MRLACPCLALFLLAAACGGSDERIPIDGAGAVDQLSDLPDGATGDICGGFGGFQCAETHWCDWDDNSCGATDGTGTCQPRPTDCKPLEEPVCGCDGTVYATDCAAQAAGQDLADAGGCTAPADSFACGHRLCDARSQYCRRAVSDVAGIPDGWDCLPFPAGCGASPDCACLDAEPCGDMCTVTGDGLRLTCPGG